MAQAHVPSIDGIICREVTRLVSCTVPRIGRYPLSHLIAIDRLSREGTLTVSRTGCFGYVVSIGPAPQTLRSSQGGKSQALFGR
jgi:hypothetical protein